MDERRAEIEIGGKRYELLLTTRATKEIAQKYGGLDKLGDRMLKSDNALEEIVWLLTLLVNQPILIRNHQGANEELLSEDDVELLTTPADLTGFRDAITEALVKGTRRNVEGERGPGKAANP